MGGKWRGWHWIGCFANHRKPLKWSPLKFLGHWQSENSVWRSFLKAPQPSPIITVCVCSCVCNLLCSGFIRLQWCLDSRKSSTNRTEWCRNGQKAPLEFLKLIFSLPYFYTLTMFQSLIHSLPTPFCSFHSPLHQHCSAFSALAVKRPWCCPTNFSHPFYSCYSPFPKSTLSQQGEAFRRWLLVQSNFSLFAPLSRSLASLSILFFLDCPFLTFSLYFYSVLSLIRFACPSLVSLFLPMYTRNMFRSVVKHQMKWLLYVALAMKWHGI